MALKRENIFKKEKTMKSMSKIMYPAGLTLCLLSSAVFAKSSGRTVTVAQLKSAADAVADLIPDGGEGESKSGSCTFKVAKTAKGLSLSIETEKAGSVRLLVPAGNQIKFTTDNSPDGSYDEKYAIEGVGSVEIIHADDAFDEVTLSNDEASHTCGAYY